MTEFSFIIPAYNEEEWIAQSVRAIQDASNANSLAYEVIVVDNHSTDGTEKQAKEAGASVVHEPIRQIARVRNRGAQAAEGAYLVFIDADTIVSERVVGKMAAKLRTGEVVGGGAIVASDRQDSVMDYSLHIWNTISKRFRLAAGSYLFSRRETFEQIGGFNERLYATEEIDLSIRLGRRGAREGLRFEILEEPVVTSARKVDWYSNWQLALRFFIFLFLPWAIYYRSLCGFWYDRSAREKE